MRPGFFPPDIPRLLQLLPDLPFATSAAAPLPAGLAESFAGEATETSSAEPVWVLLGAKHGDNTQLLALAESLSLPYRRVQLEFNARHLLPPVLQGRSLGSLKDRSAFQAPWPRLVLSSGRRSVAAARFIRAQAGEACRLVHVGRPWGPCHWFDLVVTTPQYALPDLPNVCQNLLPVMRDLPATRRAPLAERFATLPRPWIAVLIGGNSRPLVLTPEVAQVLALQLDREQAARGGSLMVLASPRTPRASLDAMRPLLHGPHAVWAWGEPDNPYPALRDEADGFVVTDDSVQMVSELLVSGRPVRVFPLPERPDPVVRLVRAWRRGAARHRWLRPAFEWARRNGLLASLRSIALFHRQLAMAGVYGNPERARALQAAELQATLQRIRPLLREAQAAAER